MYIMNCKVTLYALIPQGFSLFVDRGILKWEKNPHLKKELVMELVRLFEPITINGLEISNRIVMPSMGLGYTDDYTFNERFAGFYRERAQGGVGLMTVGPIAIDQVGAAPFMPGLFDDRNIESLRNFIDTVHSDTETRVATQLFHMGRNAFSLFTGQTPIAPSPVMSTLNHEMPREMTGDDIEGVKNAFASAAVRAGEAGFDFIELIACTGYLISQFLSPVTNKREDEYGGSFENRMRFGLEVIKRVREAVGNDVPLGIRIAGNDFLEGGNTNVEAALFAAEAARAGIDAINVTGGWHETNIPQLTTNVPPGAYVYLARGVKAKVDASVFASNRLGDPLVAERALRSGSCDMVCMGRALIADPELPNKVKEGKLKEVISCISCNQGCFDALFSGNPVSCILNPRAGRENELVIKKTRTKKRILVAGGGPAGMEFALTAAGRGHDVTLHETEKDLGGQVNLAKAPPGKKELQKLIDSMRNRMDSAGVKVRMNSTVTPGMISNNDGYDLLVIASGAEPLKFHVPGIDKPHVVSAWDVLLDNIPTIGQNVVIVGGSATGCETAHFIASMGTPDPGIFTHLMYHGAEDPEFATQLLYNSGRTITVIDMVNRMADNVGRTSRWSLLKCLKLMGVALRPQTRLLEITDDAVVVETEGGTESIPADMVVLAMGARSVDTLSEECATKGVPCIKIGDADAPRKITDAVREGFEKALTV